LLAAALLVATALAAPSLEAEVAAMTPREKAALVVVSGLPAPPDVGGVIVRRGTRDLPRPAGALVFVDQEGGEIRTFPGAPVPAAADVASADRAFALGIDTAASLGRRGVDVDLAPVLDAPDGPLGTRHYRSADIGIAFARGLARGGLGACAKHFPGLGSTAVSTDVRRPVHGVVRGFEVAGFRGAVEAGVPCVMVGHAIYPRFGPGPASLEPGAYRLLRSIGFAGVTITDSLDVVSAHVGAAARRAVKAGADLVLVPERGDGERAIRALVPLARAGELDGHVARVLRYRRAPAG
jgi:beta-glucosidase-like glycosyl hydrolase